MIGYCLVDLAVFCSKLFVRWKNSCDLGGKGVFLVLLPSDCACRIRIISCKSMGFSFFLSPIFDTAPELTLGFPMLILLF